MSEGAAIALLGLLLGALSGTAAILWRAAVEFGRLNVRLDKLEEGHRTLNSDHKALRGKVEETREELKSGLDWENEK